MTPHPRDWCPEMEIQLLAVEIVNFIGVNQGKVTGFYSPYGNRSKNVDIRTVCNGYGVFSQCLQ